MPSHTFTRLTRDIEIGANCYALEIAGKRIVLDCGAHPQFDGRASLPLLEALDPGSVDAVVLTHAHSDHLGSLPVLQRHHPEAPVFCTEATRRFGEVMLHNSVNVMQRRQEAGADAPLFYHREVDRVLKRWQPLPLETRFDLSGERLGPHGEADVSIELFDAGHIVGSAGVRIRTGERTIFYTGDVQFEDQSVCRAATFPEEPVDVLIMETTRGDHAMPPGWSRAAEEERFAAALREVFDQGGGVLIPTFALGKTQEVLAMVHRFRRRGLLGECPIYIGGLGAKLTEVTDKLAGRTRRQAENLSLLHEVAPFVLAGERAADAPMKPRRIYALSSGMMTEATVSNSFAPKVLSNPEHAVFFIGYCDPDSPGYAVRHASRGSFVQLAKDAEPVQVNCRIEPFAFSGHATRESLCDYARRLQPKTILLVHGSSAAGVWFQETLQAELPNTRIVVPQPGIPLDI